MARKRVQKATQFLPDIILTDMMMPEKDGLQICQELQVNHINGKHSHCITHSASR